jgi:hypothetical protein
MFIYNLYFTWDINWIFIVHRPGDDPCYECNNCACSNYLGGWRVSTIHSKCFLSVHSLTTSCSTCLMSWVLCTNIAVCRSYQKQSINPPPSIASSPSHSNRHAYTPWRSSRELYSVSCSNFIVLAKLYQMDRSTQHKFRLMLSWNITTSAIFLPIALEVFLEVGVQRIALRSSARVKKRWYCRELGLTFMRLLPVIIYCRHAEARTHQFKLSVRKISLLLWKT